jgi:hypothetical protein
MRYNISNTLTKSNHVRRKAAWFEERMTRTNDGSPKKIRAYGGREKGDRPGGNSQSGSQSRSQKGSPEKGSP